MKFKTKPQQSESRFHPWRVCPIGKHWVRAHPRNRISSKGKPYTQSVDGFCRVGTSRLDHLYRDEINEISDRNFTKLSGPPASNNLGFGKDGTKYDALIRGWVRYWNKVLNPTEQLDPDIIKALIASESSFKSDAYNRRKGSNAAYGLMQVTNGTVQLLKNPKELKNHFLNLVSNDMKIPNLSICAGVRRLFRKKQIVESKVKKQVSWIEAVREFKGYKVTDKNQSGVIKFNKYYKLINGK